MDRKNKIEVPFSREAPDCRTIYKGGSLEGNCVNEKCKFYKSRIIWHIGFGEFNLVRQIATAKCPICKEKAKNVDNLFYYLAEIEIEGQIGEGDTFTRKDRATNKNAPCTFVNKDDCKQPWNYIQMKVTELK